MSTMGIVGKTATQSDVARRPIFLVEIRPFAVARPRTRRNSPSRRKPCTVGWKASPRATLQPSPAERR